MTEYYCSDFHEEYQEPVDEARKQLLSERYSRFCPGYSYREEIYQMLDPEWDAD